MPSVCTSKTEMVRVVSDSASFSFLFFYLQIQWQILKSK